MDGVWVVYDYDTTPYPISIWGEEIQALRQREMLGYGRVSFWKFGTQWTDIDK